MQVSDIFSMGGRCGDCDCDGGRRFHGFRRFDDFNDRHFRRSRFFRDGFRSRRFHDRDDGISISIL